MKKIILVFLMILTCIFMCSCTLFGGSFFGNQKKAEEKAKKEQEEALKQQEELVSELLEQMEKLEQQTTN